MKFKGWVHSERNRGTLLFCLERSRKALSLSLSLSLGKRKLKTLFSNKVFLLCVVFLSILFGSFLVKGAGAANFDGWSHQKVINLSGTGSSESNYIIPLNIHYGAKSGDDTATDVYLDGQSKTDFSDIRFTDAQGNELSYDIYSHGNYEVIPDNTRLGNTNIITSNGTIVASNIPGVTAGVAQSTDNGNTWTVLYNQTAQIIWVDPITGYFFANAGNLLLRSTDSAHLVWNTVIDMTSASGVVLPYGATEDANGTLFMGRYQTPNAALIWRSIDGGATWQVVYDATGDATKQHIHGLGVDPYTGYVYAGVDGAQTALIRSTDCTDRNNNTCQWTTLGNNDAVVQMIFADGYRMFTNESPQLSVSSSYSSIMKTTDDITFTGELITGQDGRVIRQIGNSIYATMGTQYHARYPQIMKRQDDGTWQTIWAAKYDTTVGNDGPRWADSAGTPNGASEQQLLIGPASNRYSNTRLFDGGNHYQAMVYVKIPSLSAGGGNITIHYGNQSASTTSDASIYQNLTQPNLLAQWKLDEGNGTTVADATLNNKSAILTPGTGSWNTAGGRRAGSDYPYITLPGKSYHFNGDGYTEITGSDTDPDFQFTKNFTAMAWVKTGSTGTQWIVGKGAAASSHWSLSTDTGGSGGALAFTYDAANYKIARGGFIADNTWHMVAVSIDDNSNLTGFVDGTASTPVALSPVITTNSGAVQIGADASGAQPFIGDIDDVQIYNSALSATQMRQIYEDRMFNGALEPGVVIPPKTYYVNGSTGSDSNTLNQAQNPATPWKTLQHAEETADDGSTVHIAQGIYVENSTTTHSWYLTKGLNYIADGSVTVRGTAPAVRVIYLANGSSTQSFSGITFDGQGLTGSVLSLGSNVGNKTFTNCVFTGSTSTIIGTGTNTGIMNFDNSTFNRTAGSVLNQSLAGTPTFNFSKSIFTGGTGETFSINTGTSTISVDRSLIIEPLMSSTVGVFQTSTSGTFSLTNSVVITGGMLIYQVAAGGAGSITVKNNIIYSTRAASGKIIHFPSTSGWTLTSDYNDIYSNTNQILTFRIGATTYNTYALWKAAGYETNGKNADPLFVNYGTGDYRLTSSSTLRDAGTNVGFTSDIVGTAVPQGSAPDIGAYEYVLAIVPAAPTVNVTSSTYLTTIINTNGNVDAAEYAISCDGDTTFLNHSTNACEAIADDAAHWRTYANWGGINGFADTGLTANTAHTYKVKARNGDHIETALSGGTTQTTLTTHTLVYSAGANGSVVGTSPQTVDHGTSGAEVTATPATGYHFVCWSDSVLTATRTDTNVTADITVAATFISNEILTPEAIVEEITGTLHNYNVSTPYVYFSAPSAHAFDLPFTFDASDSFSAKGIAKYGWDFGDGATAEGMKVDHQYQSPGRYTVTLTVTDKAGKTATKQQTVDANPSKPTVEDISADGSDLVFKGKSYPKTIVHLEIHSDPISVQTNTDDKGEWVYKINDAKEVLGAGDHTVLVSASYVLADQTELKSEPSKTYDFKVSLDGDKLKVEMGKTRTWQYVSLGFGLIIILLMTFLVLRRKKRF